MSKSHESIGRLIQRELMHTANIRPKCPKCQKSKPNDGRYLCKKCEDAEEAGSK